MGRGVRKYLGQTQCRSSFHFGLEGRQTLLLRNPQYSSQFAPALPEENSSRLDDQKVICGCVFLLGRPQNWRCSFNLPLTHQFAFSERDTHINYFQEIQLVQSAFCVNLGVGALVAGSLCPSPEHRTRTHTDTPRPLGA